MVPPVLLGCQRPEDARAVLDRWQQMGCSMAGFLVAVAVFWSGYGVLTGAMTRLGLLAGTALVALFFTVWGVFWAASEHVACRHLT